MDTQEALNKNYSLQYTYFSFTPIVRYLISENISAQKLIFIFIKLRNSFSNLQKSDSPRNCHVERIYGKKDGNLLRGVEHRQGDVWVRLFRLSETFRLVSDTFFQADYEWLKIHLFFSKPRKVSDARIQMLSGKFTYTMPIVLLLFFPFGEKNRNALCREACFQSKHVFYERHGKAMT